MAETQKQKYKYPAVARLDWEAKYRDSRSEEELWAEVVAYCKERGIRYRGLNPETYEATFRARWDLTNWYLGNLSKEACRQEE